MANRLKMAKIDTILALYQRRWSIRRIAKELGIHRDTVARHIEVYTKSGPPRDQLADVKTCTATPAEGAQDGKLGHPEGGAQPFKLGQAPIGSPEAKLGQPIGSMAPSEASGADGLLPAPASTLAASKQASLCEPWRAVILDKLAAGLTAQRIYQELAREHAFAGKYHSVRRFVRRLGQGQPLPFRNWDCPLAHYENDVFLTDAEGMQGPVEFQLDKDSKVSALKIVGRLFKRFPAAQL
jgi:hypothetical protein